ASNEGIGGTGVFLAKTGVNLEFKNINAGSDKIIVTNDAANNEIDIDVNEANLNITSAQIEDGTISTLDIADNAVTAANILNATILAEDLNQMDATDGQVLKWNGTASAWIATDD